MIAIEDAQSRELAIRDKLIEKRRNEVVAPYEYSAEYSPTVMAPCCPSCGNCDPRPLSKTSILPIETFASSGMTMKCLACGSEGWRCFHTSMDQFGFTGQRENINVRTLVKQIS